LDIKPTEAAVEAIQVRWQQAAARSVERLLRPQSIAVVGASRTRGTIGHEIFRNLLNGGFNGPVYPVHPTAQHTARVTAYPPVAGRLGFSSQSGGLGIAVLEEADRRGLGLSSFVSVGNKADVSGNDLLRYWQADNGTDVILLYLESFGNPRQFARVAREVSR